MHKVGNIVVAIIIIAVVGVGAYLLMKGPGGYSKNSNTSTSSSQSQSTASSGQNSTQTVAATITYTDSGFSPAVTTVKSGDTVRITNSSSQTMQLDSNPHPVHTDDEELNVGTVNPGESKTFTVTTKGHWGYHNHLNPSMTGKITVE